MKKKSIATGLMLITAAVSAQGFVGWSMYKDIGINTTASGADVAADVTDFPILVRLNATNAADVFAGALPGGADLRFAKASDTSMMLPYEIESWDSAGMTAAIWVRLDTVQGDDSVAALRMYWGNPDTTAASSGSAVFDTTLGYVGVWHMNGDDTETDVTANGYVATPTGTPDVEDSAAIGAGRLFDGTEYFRAIGSAAGAMDLPADGQYTLSAWVRPDSVNPSGGGGHVIVNKGDHQWTLATYAGAGDAPNRWYEITTKANNTWNQTTTAPLNDYEGLPLNDHVGTWRYMTGTWNGTTPTAAVGRIYIDGVLQKTTTPDITTNANGMNAGRSTARDVHIGALSNQGAGSAEPTGAMERYWVGALDEIRVTKTARDSNWIRLEFETQKPGSMVLAFDSTVTREPPTAVGRPAFRAAQGFSVRAYGQGLSFRLDAAHDGKAVLNLTDMWGRTVFTAPFNGRTLTWDGQATNGRALASGVYMARVTLRDAQGRTVQVLDRKVPYTR